MARILEEYFIYATSLLMDGDSELLFLEAEKE